MSQNPLPRLWCPLLTHYDADARLDFERMRAHLDRLRPHVDAFLIPGSTGDGWQLSDAETDDVIGFALEQQSALLVGALRPTVDGMRAVIERTLARPGAQKIVGFTVCAPHGDLTQAQIEAALDEVLAIEVPTALYQLPQITGNRIAPETLARLAARHENLLLFKDSGGEDTVALSGLDFGGVTLVRGAEGDYARWLKPAGPYDGFLLSTANSFPAELAALVAAPESGRAKALSVRVAATVADAFAAVRDVPWGNAFANANKALDHVFAHGPDALRVAPPTLHGGALLPLETIAAARATLAHHGFLPEFGYLAQPDRLPAR